MIRSWPQDNVASSSSGEVAMFPAIELVQIPVRRMYLAAAIVILNLCDVLLTRAVLDRGGIEGNPLMAGLMQGLAAPLGVKALVAGLVGILLLVSPVESKFAERAVVTVVGLYIAIVLWNSSLLGILHFG
ncbi:MAG: DUF5658 family protein [Microthrixaceae bacterium]